MKNEKPQHLIFAGKRCFVQSITNVNGFKLDKRKSSIGQRVFVLKNNEYIKTFKSLQSAYDWCIKQI